MKKSEGSKATVTKTTHLACILQVYHQLILSLTVYLGLLLNLCYSLLQAAGTDIGDIHFEGTSQVKALSNKQIK